MEQSHTDKRARLLGMALTVAILVVVNLLINVGVQLVMKGPTYNGFCPDRQVQEQILSQEACVAVGGQWIEQGGKTFPKEIVRAPAPVLQEGPQSYCNPNFTCQKNFEAAEHVYNRNVFLILIVAGLLSLLIGFWVATSSVVSLGFSWGGVLSFIIGSIRYWADMEEYLRFILLLLVLGVLVWLGLKKLRDVAA